MADKEDPQVTTDPIDIDSTDTEDIESQEEVPKQSERTKEQIDKLTEHNAELKEERDKYINVLESIRPEPQPEPQTQPIIEVPKASEYDNLQQKDIDRVFAEMQGTDGFIDGAKLQTFLKDLDTRTRIAEERAAQAEAHAKRVEVSANEKDVSVNVQALHAKYPQLNPESENFDVTFWELVRNDLIGQAIEGKEDVMAAADKWYDKLPSVSESQTDMTPEEQEEKNKATNAKTTINAIRPRSHSSVDYYKNEKDEVLAQKVRQGKRGALAEALRRHENKINKQ